MDPIETMVNNHHNEWRSAGKNKRVKNHLRIVCVCAAVAIAFLLFAVTGLAHPVLSTVVMVVALMIGSYHLGRCVRFGKGTR